LQDTYAVLPQNGEAQLRVFNGFNSEVAVDLSGVESGKIDPLNFWQAPTLSVDGESTFELNITCVGCMKTRIEEKVNVTEMQVICNK
jgi:hypothetical protein